MKITKIVINKYAHFKEGLVLDFTYPEGHEKAGQPLDKVCFIGKSSTGKTNILNLIHYFVTDLINEVKEDDVKRESNWYQKCPNFVNRSDNFEFHFQFDELENDNIFKVQKNIEYCVFNYENENYDIKKFLQQVISQKDKNNSEIDQPILIHFGSERQRKFDFWENIKKPSDYNQYIFYFGETFTEWLWTELSNELENYYAQELFYKSKLYTIFTSYFTKNYTKLDINDSTNVINFTKTINEKLTKLNENDGEFMLLLKNYTKWNQGNKNPVFFIGDRLDNVLANFGVQVKRNIDGVSFSDLSKLNLERLDDTNTYLPYEGWSSGTRNIILTVLPLIKLKPINAIVLIDEPENSLFPDMQRKLVKIYTKDFTTDCQVFIATHSPIVASEFEPCERFIFHYEDEDYKTVTCKRGEVATGNTPDRILEDDYQIEELLGEEGLKKRKEVDELSTKIYLRKKEVGIIPNDTIMQDLLYQREKIIDDYKFDMPFLNL